MLKRKCSRSATVVLCGTVFAVIFLFFLPSLQAQSVVIDDARNTTQILENLYSGGDKTASVTSTGSVIVPGGSGIYALSTGWTVTNAGTVSANTGMLLNLGGSVINSSGITGTGGSGNYGIYLGNGAGAVNSVTNNATGTIAGGADGTIGIRAFVVTPFSLDNSGLVYGTSERAVLIEGQGSITNRTGGQIIGGYGGTAGTAIHVTTSATVQNDGIIAGNGPDSHGIFTGTTGNIANTSNGVIIGGGGIGGRGIGIRLDAGGNVDNSGTIVGNDAQGILMQGTGTVINRTGGAIAANGATIGVHFSSGTGACYQRDRGNHHGRQKWRRDERQRDSRERRHDIRH